MHPFRMTRQKNLLEMLLQKTGKMVAKRELTQKDFQERLEVLSESSPI
jgi:hypothetical protein